MSEPNTVNQSSFEPLVSCVLPTCNRSHYIPLAINLFLAQNYDGAELLIVDDGSEPVESLVPEHPRIRYVYLKDKMTIGAKRNACCELTRGQIIMHWDDDDWFANWRVSYQVAHLIHSGKKICGINRMYYADPQNRKAWIYAFPERFGTWIAGGSFCYLKTLWQSNPFPEVNDGEDTQFIKKIDASDVLNLERYDFYVGRIHPNNTSKKNINQTLWFDLPMNTIESVIGDDFEAWSK